MITHARHEARNQWLTELAVTLRRARELAGLSQLQLAEQVGCDASTICNWEAGRRRPNLATLFDVAVALNLDPGGLLPDVVSAR